MSRDGWSALPRGATGLSAVCDCGISWSYSLTIFTGLGYFRYYPLFLHRCHFVELITPTVKRTKILVQIRRFVCCLNMGLNLKILKMRPSLFTRRYIRKALRTRLIISPIFCSQKRCVRLSRCDDVMTFESTQPMPFLFRETQCKKMDNLIF